MARGHNARPMPTLKQLLHDARWHPRWRLLLMVLAAFTAYHAFAPSPSAIAGSFGDKADHLAAFAAMASAAALAGPATWRHAGSALAGLLAYGAFIEIVQALLPTRQADLADLLADGLGALGGLLLVAVLRRCWIAPISGR